MKFKDTIFKYFFDNRIYLSKLSVIEFLATKLLHFGF